MTNLHYLGLYFMFASLMLNQWEWFEGHRCLSFIAFLGGSLCMALALMLKGE